MKTTKIKLFDSLVLTIDGKETILHSFPELWESIGWNIDDDPAAKECAEIITRELYCFGFMDLSALTNHEHKVTIAVRKEENDV